MDQSEHQLETGNTKTARKNKNYSQHRQHITRHRYRKEHSDFLNKTPFIPVVGEWDVSKMKSCLIAKETAQ